jgi:hypothetical protein
MSNQLFENAVKACKSAMSLSNETEALSKHLETLQGETVSAVEIACAESYAWFISVNRKHGSKQDLATASGVSGKTIGRWIASGHVALVTEGKATASEVNSAIGNYSMKIAEVERVQTLTEWRNLLKAYKAVNKSGAGKVVGKAETTEATEATAKATKGWKSHAENLVKSIESGEVGLMEVMDYMTTLVSELGLSIDEMEEVAI